MITLQQWFSTIDYKVTEGSEYTWECYGDHAYRLEYWDHQHDGVSCEIVFDTYDQTVYEVTVHDFKNEHAYRLINPEYIVALKQESSHKNTPFDQAWDEVAFTDLELDYDWIEKAKAIIEGKEYDTRVQIELNLPKHELFALMQEAHKRDMTFNEYVEEAVMKAISNISEQDIEELSQLYIDRHSNVNIK